MFLITKNKIEGVEIFPLKFKERGCVLDILHASILSIIVCLTVYLIAALARLLIRKAHKTQKESEYVYFANKCKCNNGVF